RPPHRPRPERTPGTNRSNCLPIRWLACRRRGSCPVRSGRRDRRDDPAAPTPTGDASWPPRRPRPPNAPTNPTWQGLDRPAHPAGGGVCSPPVGPDATGANRSERSAMRGPTAEPTGCGSGGEELPPPPTLLAPIEGGGDRLHVGQDDR